MQFEERLKREKEIRMLGAEQGLPEGTIGLAIVFGATRMAEKDGRLPDPATAIRRAVEDHKKMKKTVSSSVSNSARMARFYEAQEKVEKEMGIRK